MVHTATHPSPASDLVTCALFSPLATHLALASADHHIRVTTQDPHNDNAWDCTPREWKAHDGPVLALAWAHPSFGSLLASGGSDGALHLWLDDNPPGASDPSHTHGHGHAHGHSRAQAGWHCTASLLDARGTLRSISFAPPEAGLKLAAVSSDNHLRVWECLDPLALRDWQLREDVDLAALPLSPSSGAALQHHSAHGDRSGAGSALGSGDGFGIGGGGGGGAGGAGAAGSGVTPGSSAGSIAAPFPSVSSASSVSGTGTGTGGGGGGGGGARAGGTVESDGAWAVSWCQEAWWGERIAVSSGSNGLIRLFHFPSASSPSSAPWTNFLNLLPSRPFITSSSHTGAVSSSTPTSSAFSVIPGTGASAAAGGGNSSASSGPDDPDGPYGQGHGSTYTHTPPTSSLAWAPPSGRSFLLLAAGARDGRARVWKVVPPPLGAPPAPNASAPGAGAGGGTGPAGAGEGLPPVEEGEWAARLEVELDAAPPAERTSGAAAAGGAGAGGAGGAGGGPGGAMTSARVAWNVTGTVLSTSGGDDARVRLWKPTYTGQWRQLAVLGTEDGPGA